MYYWCTDFICLYFLKFFHRVLGVVIVDYIKSFFRVKVRISKVALIHAVGYYI